jgi:hypothetical protein
MSAVQDYDEDSPAIDLDCGGASDVPLAWFDRATSSWRTSQGSLLAASTLFSDPWPVSGSMRSGQLFEHPTFRPRIVAPVCSSWLTLSEWPTPQARDHKGVDLNSREGGSSLPHHVLTGARTHGADGRLDRENRSTIGSRRERSRLESLNLRWVLCLMGFQPTWLDGIAPGTRQRATPSSRKSRKS